MVRGGCGDFPRAARGPLLLDAPARPFSRAAGLSLMSREAQLEVQIDKKLADFTLDVAFRASETPLSILGASGAGKTMLLRCIAGIENPDRGRIALGDRVLFDSE